MKDVIKSMKKHNFCDVSMSLKERKYIYSLDNFSKDFFRVNGIDRYCYLIYLLAKEYTQDNVILLCDYLMYMDKPFYDVHPVIHMYLQQALTAFPEDKKLISWIVEVYENHPDSPFSQDEISEMKSECN